MELQNATPEQLTQWEQALASEYEQHCQQNMRLDLTRGKPSSEQLSLADALDGILKGNYTSANGIDARNYGGLEGLAEARQLGADILGLEMEQVLALGNSSLSLMFLAMSVAYHHGFNGPESAWKNQPVTKFICPVPGYDRHYGVCETLGIEMITVAMTETGPDMEAIEALLACDPTIKGLWCVPKYSNPTGTVYSDATVERIAKLGLIAGEGFRVFWDNAYAVHDLSTTPKSLAPIMAYCQQHNTIDSVIQFASTSKITHAGAGVAFIGMSADNIRAFNKVWSASSIGPDKVNQLRHMRLLPNYEALLQHMQKHAQIIKPRFQCVLEHLENAFATNDLGQWESADGGYFISFHTRKGLAKDVVALAAQAGVKLTPAGATFPYGHDPEDSNIRIAPTVPTVEDVDAAMKVFVTCVKLASVRQALKANAQ